MSEYAEEGGPHYSLHIDFSGAHRQRGVVKEDWGRQACQVSGTAAEASKLALKAIADEAHKLGLPLIVDDTFTTPYGAARLRPRRAPRRVS